MRQFAWGLLVGGAVAAAGFWAASKCVAPERLQAARAEAREQAARPGAAAGAPAPADRLKVAEAEAARLRADLVQATSRAELAEGLLQSLGERHAEVRKEIQEAGQKNRERNGKRARQLELASLQQKMVVGKPLPQEVIDYLGLDSGSRESLERERNAETEAFRNFFRQVIGETPEAQSPKSDSLDDHFIALLPALMPEMERLKDALGSPEVMSGEKTVYLEDVMGKGSIWVRLMEGFEGVRGRTLAATGKGLTPAQQAKLDELMRGRFSFGATNAMLPENVHPRRPN